MNKIPNFLKKNRDILFMARSYAIATLCGKVPQSSKFGLIKNSIIFLLNMTKKNGKIPFYKILIEPYKKKIKEADILYGESFALFFIDWFDMDTNNSVVREEIARLMSAFIILYIIVLEIDDYVDIEGDITPDFGDLESNTKMKLMGEMIKKEFLKYEFFLSSFINLESTNAIQDVEGKSFNRKQLIRFLFQDTWTKECLTKMYLLVFYSSLFKFDGKLDLIDWISKTDSYIKEAKESFFIEKQEEKKSGRGDIKLEIASGKNNLLLIQAEILDRMNTKKDGGIVKVTKMLLKPMQMLDDVSDWVEDYQQKKRTFLLREIKSWDMTKEEVLYNLIMYRNLQETMKIIINDLYIIKKFLLDSNRNLSFIDTYITNIIFDLGESIKNLDFERIKILELKVND